jgi:hypothetical protein
MNRISTALLAAIALLAPMAFGALPETPLFTATLSEVTTSGGPIEAADYTDVELYCSQGGAPLPSPGAALPKATFAVDPAIFPTVTYQSAPGEFAFDDWECAVRAQAFGEWSGLSNSVTFTTFDAVPEPPGNLLVE